MPSSITVHKPARRWRFLPALVPAIGFLLATVVLFSAVNRWTAEDAQASDRRAEDFDY